MAVIDAEYYCNVFGGTAAADERELAILISRAEMQIETVIGRSVLGEFSHFQRVQLQRAVALQTEYLIAQGGLPSAGLGAGSGESVSLGGYSEGKNAAGKRASMIAPAALACLTASGLIYRGVGR